MSSDDLIQIKAQIEQIFKDVNLKLDGFIMKDATLMMGNDEDIMHERLFAFCDEMEALKRKIANQQLALSIRMESVGNASQYIKDLIEDVREHKDNETKKSYSKDFMNVLDYIETSFGMIAPDITVIEDTLLAKPETDLDAAIENYFDGKLAELRKIVNENPDLQKE